MNSSPAYLRDPAGHADSIHVIYNPPIYFGISNFFHPRRLNCTAADREGHAAEAESVARANVEQHIDDICIVIAVLLYRPSEILFPPYHYPSTNN